MIAFVFQFLSKQVSDKDLGCVIPVKTGTQGVNFDKKAYEMNKKKRDIWQEVLDGVREIKAGGGKRFTVEVSPITNARQKVGFSPIKFAELLGVSEHTLQDWELGQHQPSGAARSLLMLAEKRPEVLREVFG